MVYKLEGHDDNGHTERLIARVELWIGLDYDRIRIRRESIYMNYRRQQTATNCSSFFPTRRAKQKVAEQSLNFPPAFIYAGPNSLDSVQSAFTGRTLIIEFLAIVLKSPELSVKLDRAKYVQVLKRLDTAARKALVGFMNAFIAQTKGYIRPGEEFHFHFNPIQLLASKKGIVSVDKLTEQEWWWMKRGLASYSNTV